MENIELRSEKVRNIIGEIPPFFTRTGTVIIMVIVLALGIASCIIRYPLTTEADGKVDLFVNGFGDHYYSAKLLMPYKYNDFYHELREVDMTFEGRDGLVLRDSMEFSAEDKAVEVNGENYFILYVHIKEKDADKYNIQHGMKVHGVAVVDNRTIWQLLFKMPVD